MAIAEEIDGTRVPVSKLVAVLARSQHGYVSVAQVSQEAAAPTLLPHPFLQCAPPTQSVLLVSSCARGVLLARLSLSRDLLSYPVSEDGRSLSDALRRSGDVVAAATCDWCDVATTVLGHCPSAGTTFSTLPPVSAPVRELLALRRGAWVVALLQDGTITVFDAVRHVTLFRFHALGSTSAAAPADLSRRFLEAPPEVCVLARASSEDVLGGEADGACADCVVLNLTSFGQGVHVREGWQLGLMAALPCRLTSSQEATAGGKAPSHSGFFVAATVLALLTRRLLVCWERASTRVVVFDTASGAPLALLQHTVLSGAYRHGPPPALHLHPGSGHVVGVWGRQGSGPALGTVVTTWDLAAVQWLAAALQMAADAQSYVNRPRAARCVFADRFG